MPKALCYIGMVIAILVFLFFLLDLILPWIGLRGLAPFQSAKWWLDGVFVVCSVALGYLSWSTLREQD